jgi:tetratricopeptide (TPR) repeat protein
MLRFGGQKGRALKAPVVSFDINKEKGFMKDFFHQVFQRFQQQWLVVIIFFMFVVICVGFFSIKFFVSDRDVYKQIRSFERAVKKNPQDWVLKNKLGDFYRSVGDTEVAQQYYLQALKIQPDNVDLYFSLANMYSRAGNAQKVVEVLKKVIELDPEFAEAYYNLTGPMVFLGNEKKAFEYLNKAIELWKSQGKILEAGEAAEAFYIFLAKKRGMLKQISVEDFIGKNIVN